MKKILLPLSLILLFSCSKNEELPQPPAPVPPGADSLGQWKKHTTGSAATIWDISFLDAARGLLCDREGIKRSVDSGKTWVAVHTKADAYWSMQFVDQQHGFCVGTEFAFTRDGGNTWSVRSLPSRAMDLFFTSPSTGFLASEIGLYRTLDTGTTWTMIKQDLWTAIYFTDASNGWAATSRPGTIYKTTDGGITWSALQTPQPLYNVFTIFFIGLRGWTVTDGPLFITTNGGQFWDARTGPPLKFDLQFVDPSTGYMTTSNEVVRSTDGGITWKTDARLTGKRLVELFFLDAQHGWAAGDDGVVLRYKAP